MMTTTDEMGRVPVLAARGLVKEYREADSVNRVLDGVDLDVAEGSFTAVMGPSGSGKSTLLHLLGGLDRPDAGEVRVRGRPLSELPDNERTDLRRSEIGIVYQFFNLIPVLNVEENVALPAVIAGRSESSYRARRDEIIELVGLGDHRHKPPTKLSGGEQQRAAIARALFIEPAVVLADEPTGNLDAATGAEVLALFDTARREMNQTIVMVTHDYRSAGHGDEIVVLRDGRIERRLPLDAEAAPGLDDPAHPERARRVLRWLEGPEGAEPGDDGRSGGAAAAAEGGARTSDRPRRRRQLRSGGSDA